MKLISIPIVALLLSFNSFAQERQPWHEPVYELGCKSCHDKGVKNYPSDQSCLSCHDVDELAEATARDGDEQWQNPHNNLHYGKDTPCVECHGEHKKDKQPMCKECHEFQFNNFKG